MGEIIVRKNRFMLALSVAITNYAVHADFAGNISQNNIKTTEFHKILQIGK
jgi:hypothetical protein